MTTLNIMSYYLANNLINHIIRNTSYTPSSSIYAALYISDPTKLDTGTEVSGGGYSRIQCPAFTIGGGTATSGGINFGPATSYWGTVNYIGIKDDGGHLLFYGALTYPLVVDISNNVKIDSNLKISLRGDTFLGWGAAIADDVLNFVLNGYSYPTPGTSIYLALGRSLITTATYNFSSWLEIPQAAGYSRKLIGNDWNYISEGTVFNLNNIVFTENATVNWGNIANCALFNSSSAGEPVFWGTIGTPRNILTGDGLIFPSNSIRVSIDAQV